MKFVLICFNVSVYLEFIAVLSHFSQFRFSFVSVLSKFRLIFIWFSFLFLLSFVSFVSLLHLQISILCKSLEILKKRAGEGKKHVSHVTNGSRKLVAFFHSPARHYTTATHHSIAWKEAIYQTREILVHSQQQKCYVHRGPRKWNLFITSESMLI